MNHNLLLIYLIIHIIGDYYLQNDQMAYKKRDKFKTLFLHCLVYLLLGLILIIPIWSTAIFLYTIGFGLAHFAIDFLKLLYYKATKKMMQDKNFKDHWQSNGKYVYLIDQLLHIVSIVVIVYFYTDYYGLVEKASLFGFRGTLLTMPLRYVLMVLVIIKPVNITFRQLFLHTKPDEKEESEENNTGEIVGDMERLLILVLLSLNQFTAIGLVFTAKSITRYDKISKEKAFAEYYLIGTLFSLLATLILYLVILKS